MLLPSPAGSMMSREEDCKSLEMTPQSPPRKPRDEPAPNAASLYGLSIHSQALPIMSYVPLSSSLPLPTSQGP